MTLVGEGFQRGSGEIPIFTSYRRLLLYSLHQERTPLVVNDVPAEACCLQVFLFSSPRQTHIYYDEINGM